MKNIILAIICSAIWGILVTYTKDYQAIRLLISGLGGYLIGNYFVNRELKSYKDPNISLLQRKLKTLKGCSCTYNEIDK